jgi:SAM-dependent methyltransferase
MQNANDRSEDGSFSPFDIWEKGGSTTHLGGISATRALMDEISPLSNNRILEIGCGTGYTSSLLASIPGIRLTSFDLLHGNLRKAQNRLEKLEANQDVRLLQADAHWLPFQDRSFTCVLLESVLVFCDQTRVLSEIQRVLEPGGKILLNEFTFLKPPDASLLSIVKDRMHLEAKQQSEWESLLISSGFRSINSSVYKIRFGVQFSDHLKVDGVRNYFHAMIAGIGDRAIRRNFFNREMLAAARSFLPYVGYGLYSGIK